MINIRCTVLLRSEYSRLFIKKGMVKFCLFIRTFRIKDEIFHGNRHALHAFFRDFYFDDIGILIYGNCHVLFQLPFVKAGDGILVGDDMIFFRCAVSGFFPFCLPLFGVRS